MEEQIIKNNEVLVSSQDSYVTSDIYGSFHLCNSEFAVSVSQLQEVVETPNEFTKMPLSPDYLLGLFNLRDMVIPVIDLRMLLQFKTSNQNFTESKIGILELNGNLIGLLFEKTGEVFKSIVDEKSDFVNTDEHQVVSGVFKKEKGKRLIQIINPHSLFNLKALPKQENSHAKHQDLKGVRKQCISFMAGNSLFALGIQSIQEIIKIDKISESALAVNYCIGAIDVRGITVPLIDFSSLLGIQAADNMTSEELSSRRVIVMKIGKERFGLLVDSVESIISYFEHELKHFPILSEIRAKMFMGCIVMPNKNHALLLNSDCILSNKEIVTITHGHSSLYTAADTEIKNRMDAAKRVTYITFILETTYAIPITRIKEIIEEPESLIDSVGMPDFCTGIINLRGEMIMIIDGRKLFDKKISTANNKKVLIFKGSKFNYGLIVDSVEEIVTFPESNKIKMKNAALEEQEINLNNEALQFIDKNDKARTMLIMNPESIEHKIKCSISNLL